MKRPAEGPGTPLEPPGNRWPRWMAIQDKIRLTGLLRKKPRQRGFFYAGNSSGRGGRTFVTIDSSHAPSRA